MEEENVQASGGAPELGKFKSVDALMKAYTELEAEFTRRSQRLKALEESKAEQPPAQEAGQALPPSPERSTESGSEALYRQVMENEEVRARVLSDYLNALKGVPLMAGGGRSVPAPNDRPKTLAEAGALALGYLKKNH